MATARIDIEVVQAEVAERRLAQITQAEQRLNVQFKGGVITSEQLRKSTERLSRAKALLTRRLNTNSASLRRGTRAAAAMTTSLGSLRSIAAGVGVTFGLWQVARIIKDATRAAIDFEAEMANVSTLMETETPKGIKQLKLLEGQILALHSRLGGATQLTRGLYQALSAGIKPAEAVRFVGEAALFAKAALTDTFTAVDLITTALNAYSKSSDEAAAFSSVLFKIIKEGKVFGSQLAASLGRVVSTAAQLNIDLPELGANITTLTKRGVPAAEAMTTMVAILKTFTAVEAAERFKELGISQAKVRDIITKQGLNAALQELGRRLKGDTVATTALFRESEAQKGIFILLGKGARGYAEDLKGLKQAQVDANVHQIAAQKIFDTTKEKIAELSVEWEKFNIALLDTSGIKAASGALTSLLRIMTATMKAETELRKLSGEEIVQAFESFRDAQMGVGAGLRRLNVDIVGGLALFQQLVRANEQAATATGGHTKALEEFTASTFPAELRLIQLAVAAEEEAKQIAEIDRQIKALGPIPQISEGDLQLLKLIDDLKVAKEQEVELARQAKEMQRAHEEAFRRMEAGIDSFLTQTFFAARSLKDVWNSVVQQMLRVFLSMVAKLVAGWVLGMRQMQAISAGRALGGGGIGSILGAVFGGFGGFGSATAPGGTGTFTGAPIGSRLISGGGGIGVARFSGAQASLPTPAPGSASGIAAHGTAMAALGINPLALLATAGIAGALLGRGGNLLLGGLGGFGIGLGTTVALGALLGAPLAIGLAAGIIPGLVIGAIGLISAIISRGKKKRKAAASENILTAQLGEVIKEFKTFQTDLEGALATIDQLFAAFQGQVQPLGKAGRNAVRNISPLVFAVKDRLTEIQAARDARLLLSASSLIPEFHTGGLVDQRMLALLHPKEAVLNPVGRQAIGDQNIERLNRGETPMGDVNTTIHVHPTPGMDERALAEYTWRHFERKFRLRGRSLVG